MWLAFRLDDDGASSWRPHGLMAPPENPWLKDNLKPRVYSRGWWGQPSSGSAAERAAAQRAAGGG